MIVKIGFRALSILIVVWTWALLPPVVLCARVHRRITAWGRGRP